MKRMFKTLLFTLLGLALMTSTVFAGGVDLTGIGARATALGGNYRAVANDWSAMFWNPAGLVFTQGLNAGMSVEFVTPTVGYTAGKSLLQGQFSATSDQEITNESKTFMLPAAGVYLSTGKVALGLGFWAPFGLGAKWDLLNTSAYNKEYPEFDLEDDLKVIDIHPTIAYKVTDKLSIGVGASVILADIMIRKPTFSPNPYLYQNTTLVAGINATPDALLPPATKQQLIGLLADIKTNHTAAPLDHVLTEGILDGDGMGIGFNAGVMFKPVETLSIGLSGKFYNNIKLDGTVKAKTYMGTDAVANAKVANLKSLYDAMLAGKMIDEQSYAVLNYCYSGGVEDQVVPKEIEAELPLPMNVGLGLAYSGINKLMLSADVAFTQWSSWDVIDIKDKADGTVYTSLVENWEDGIRWGLGAEFAAMPKLTVRGSFYHEPAAAIVETMSPTIPDAGSRNVLNLGVEVPVGPLRLHGSIEKIFVGDLTVDEWILAPDKKGYENWAGDYTMSVFNFMLGCEYAF